jgi:hypothetical protein
MGPGGVSARSLLCQLSTSGTNRQLTVFDAARCQQRIRNLLYPPSFAAYGNHLQAVLMIQVNVSSCEHCLVMLVLNVSEPIDEIALMMVIDNGKRAYDFVVGLPLFSNQSVADQVSKSLRPVVPPVLLGQMHELHHQVMLNGYTEPDQPGNARRRFTHGGIVSYRGSPSTRRLAEQSRGIRV